MDHLYNCLWYTSVNCESELVDFSKYLKLDKLSTTEDGKCECNKIRVNFQTIGITCGNMFTVTSEGTDLYTTYRTVSYTHLNYVQIVMNF